MKNTFKIVSFSAPPDLIKAMQQIAKREHRTISELLRECFRQYSALANLRELAAKGKKAAKAKGVKPSDIWIRR